MQAFELNQIDAQRRSIGALYHEFLRIPSLSAGLYVLPAGGTDPQQPHTEPEMYYIVSGQGAIRVGNEDQAVQSGSIVFVPADLPHHFHSIKEEMQILVVFAPAEYSLRPEQQIAIDE